MNKKVALTIATSIFVILLIVISKSPISTRFSFAPTATNSLSPQILDLLPPVHGIAGTIEKIEESALTVSENAPGSPGKKLTYKVLITANTKLIQPQTFLVPYLFKAPAPAPLPELSLKNLQVGQVITVVTKEDLRLLQTTTFEASSIEFPSPNSTFRGTIVSISKELLTIAGSQESGKIYQVEVNKDSEIAAPGTKPQNLAFTDLKKGQTVNVYASLNSATGNFTALKIDTQPSPR